MIDQELLQDLTESYLKSLIAEYSDSVGADFDSFAAFGELGVDSFYVLKIIKKLEMDFGTLPKTLLFENFNVNDLAIYFVNQHTQTLTEKFAAELKNGAGQPAMVQSPSSLGSQVTLAQETQINVPAIAVNGSQARTNQPAEPVLALQTQVENDPELQDLVSELYEQYKDEGSVSRGVKNIAPNVFIGSERKGYINYSRSDQIILAYAYTGPDTYFPVIAQELYQHCINKGFELYILTDEHLEAIGEIPFSATPFGAVQRLWHLQDFSLAGGKMRRLRYLVSKFQKAGECDTREYRCGTDKQVDQSIVEIIDRWCEGREMVNPLVDKAKAEIGAGLFSQEHRIFLTYVDGVLQNVIIITELSSQHNGYLMDLEFYPPDMPLGGLEFAIVQIIEVLAKEGCDLLSLGATFGPKLAASENADPEVDAVLDGLRNQGVFSDEGNLQFKNKFRTDNQSIFLCRPASGGSPENVVDIIMLIADPARAQTSDEEHHTIRSSNQSPAAPVPPAAAETAKVYRSRQVNTLPIGERQPSNRDYASVLAEYAFNPLNIPFEHIGCDLKTDSWAELSMPVIDERIKRLRFRLQQPASLTESLQKVFPFDYFTLTSSGRDAEHFFYRAWPKQGVVLENTLFPTCIFHQIDKGFEPKELPRPEIFDLNSTEVYKSNLDWEQLLSCVEQDGDSIAMVCIEVDNNAAGGYPVSIEHLKQVKALLSKHAIDLVIDATRIVENARFIIENEVAYTQASTWQVTREILSYADAVVASLTKDFCVNRGGLIASNDVQLLNRLQDLMSEEGGGLDVIDKKLIALSLQELTYLETQVVRRMRWVERIHAAFVQNAIPVVHPVGAHCVLLNVQQIPEFSQFEYPVASCVAWIYQNTGIRVTAHNAGMQRNTSLNALVRLAIPLGLEENDIENIIDQFTALFSTRVNIPELATTQDSTGSGEGIYASYDLKQLHNVSADRSSPLASVPPKLPESAPTVNTSQSPIKTEPETSYGNSVVKRSAAETRDVQDIAIVGMAGRYPMSVDMDEMWQNLAQGKDCITTIPDVRIEQQRRAPFIDRYRGGFIDAVDKFDSMFFNIAPREAEMLDPQERLFLEVAWETIEDAGYYPEILGQENQPRNIGVFVGAVWAMYQMLGVEERISGSDATPNSFLWSIANRVSYWMNLSGPSLTIDTACSSSLTAIYLACEAINNQECSAAIVGGVNLDLHQTKQDINWAGGALSEDGYCRSFGSGANGYVPGEGVGAVFLKPLTTAVQDRDNIHGVIKSVVVNHGGRTSGYTVPNPKAQTDLVLSALKKADIDARTIGYIEAHGTGTELGDPIEITGLSKAFANYGVVQQACPIGSIKSNIGHLEAAAGVVGVCKVLLQMRHRKLVPSLHSESLNEFIDFESSPFYVEQQLEDWQPKMLDGTRYPLRAGVSSFGAGGANAHIILEAYESDNRAEAETQEGLRILPLSARNDSQLKAMARRLKDFLEQNLARENTTLPIRFSDISYTLKVGRKSFESRLAIIAASTAELIETLGCYLDGQQSDNILTGNIKNTQGITKLLSRQEKEAFVALLSQRRDAHKLAQLWIDGLLSDWQGFQNKESGQRISLPTYPFADKRHWASSEVQKTVVSMLSQSVMHPLIDSNHSTFERQLFKKSFNEREFFIYDHHVSDIPTLPGVAYLELARKAGEAAADRKVQKIKNILWVSPLTVENDEPTEAYIDLKPNGKDVQFEVFSQHEDGSKQLYSQGKLEYATDQQLEAESEYLDIQAIRGRCEKVIEGQEAYPLFKDFGLNLGPSFQVLQEVYKNEKEVFGVLKIPASRSEDFQDFILHPSLVDGSLQAAMGAQLGDSVDEMFVPYSIGEVEVLHPLQPNCFSYVTEVEEDKKSSSNLSKMNVFILDEEGKVLVKIRESIGVPLQEVHEKPARSDEDEVAKLYYANIWNEIPLVDDRGTQDKQSPILLFGSDETLYQALNQGEGGSDQTSRQVILVQPGESFTQQSEDRYLINPMNPEDFHQLLKVLAEKTSSINKVCFAWSEVEYLQPRGLVEQSLQRGIYSLVYLCQAFIEQKLKDRVQLLYCYQSEGNQLQPHNEAINGFAKTLILENPKLVCKTLDTAENDWTTEQFANLIQAELGQDSRDALAVRYRGEQREVRTIKQFDLHQDSEAAEFSATGIKQNGVYLITGGAGGLGLIFAEYLAREYRARLILTGRSALSADKQDKLDQLREFGAEVIYHATDVSDYQAVEALISESKAQFGALNGIIHSAGVLRDSYLKNKTTAELDAVFAPKLHGTIHLDQATQDEELDFLVLFSSLAAVGGNAGQSDYAYANAFMDSFARERNRLQSEGHRAGRTISLNWALWADGGMRLDEQTELFFKENLGISPIRTETGLEAFSKGLLAGKSQFVVIEGDQDKIETAWGIKEKPPVESAPTEVADTAQADLPEGADDLAGLVQDTLSEIAVDFLKLDEEDVSVDEILLDLGFDSIGLTTFANLVNDKYGLDVTPVLFFEYPSIREIATHIAAEHSAQVLQVHQPAGASSSGTKPVAEARVDQSAPEVSFRINKNWDPSNLETGTQVVAQGFSPELRFVNQPIAVVGMSGVMPQSENLEEFWENLKNAENMVTVIPRDRWKWEDYYGDPLKEENKSLAKWGGFMKEVDKFDPLFFGISPLEAESMDPQQRMFLESAWEAVEDAGHKLSDLSGTRTGVFVGVATNDYTELMSTHNLGIQAYTSTGNSHAVLVNRVSFLLDIHGPSAPFDTACSSSLVAAHRALESIHTGSCDMAIVGGVHVMTSPSAFISFGQAGMLSDDGKCKTFDKSANGYVRGEGSGAVLLKPLSMAEADGNHIYALVKSTAENHGGRANMLTAPNPNAQSDLLVEAYTKAQIDPATVGYIECHGTGTSLGDPIEIQALKKAFSELYKLNDHAPASVPHCGLGSVKTNIGHLETAAGIAGILKVLLAIKHKQIPASIHFEELNPYIDIKDTPFYIVDKTRPWEVVQTADGTALPRRAGISSFGFGGANAHVVLEEYIAADDGYERIAGSPRLVVISAKNEDRLRAYAEILLAHCEKETVDLDGLTYTLQVGRDAMEERLAFVVSELDELKTKLADFLLNDTDQAGFYRGHVSGKKAKKGSKAGPAQAALEQLIEAQDLPELATQWVAGTDVDWADLYQAGSPRRVSLPTYPFARERHWIPIPEDGAVEPTGITVQAANGVAQLHSLVHANVSTLAEQKFSSRFSGQEFYLADHVIDGQKILPGVAYMEMARVAGGLSAHRPVRFIRNLVWMRPVIVGEQAAEVEIVLTPQHDEVEFSVQTPTEQEPLVHCLGKLSYADLHQEPEVLDIAGIKARCQQRMLTRDGLYPFLAESGLTLGESFKVVDEIYANKDESLAILKLPEHLIGGADEFWLHPALMDGSLHTAMGLTHANAMETLMSLPFSVGEIHVLHPLKDLYYGYATWAVDDPLDDRTLLKVDFQLLDKHGKVLVRMKNFVSKPLGQEALVVSSKPQAEPIKSATPAAMQAVPQSLVPVWKPVVVSDHEQDLSSDKVLLLGQDAAQRDWLQASFPEALFVEVGDDSSVEKFTTILRENDFDHLLWVAPDFSTAAPDINTMIESQSVGVLQVFRLIKGLLSLDSAAKQLSLTVLTRSTQLVSDEDSVNPTHAGIFGLLGSVAKELPQWQWRLLDIDSLDSVSAEDCLSLPFNKLGDGLALRTGQWFAQHLEVLEQLPEDRPLYQAGRVYVVIGGAGGIGEVWSRFMVENYQAKVVWIGRQAHNDSIQEKIDTLAALGEAPIYLSADASDIESLQLAYEEIKQIYPAIHGVVHSAIVLKDQPIDEMQEVTFKSSLTAKVDISVNMDRVFGGEDLDFMLFFSSVLSFMKTPAQSNYAAGCTFKDSFAGYLRQQRDYPVKVMNWGYWGSVGVVADEFYNSIMQHVGIGSIEPREGMEGLAALVNSGVDQIVLMKTLNNRTVEDILLSISDSVAGEQISTEALQMADHSAPLQPAVGITNGSGQAALEHIRQTITGKLSEALKIGTERINNDVSFADYGLDSIVGVNLVRSISEALDIELDAISLFEHGTVNLLTNYIGQQWQGRIQSATDTADNVVTNPIKLEADTQEGVSDQMGYDHVRQIVAEKLAQALKIELSTIGDDTSFADYGVNSIVGVILIRTISEELEIELDAISLFENGTVSQLATYIWSNWQTHISERLGSSLPVLKPVGEQAKAAPAGVDGGVKSRFSTTPANAQSQAFPDSAQNTQPSVNIESIAVIGMSGRFSESESVDEFWDNLSQGRDLVKEVTRWPAVDCVITDKGQEYCSRGGFVDSIELFDPGFFRISPLEALYMDPQQRLFLEESWKALEDAGYAGKCMDEKLCGVYVGCGSSKYSNLFMQETPAQAFWGNSESIIPARIAYYLNLQGPAVAVDTACSSSLVTIHLACQSLWANETEMALAGGVFLQATSNFYKVSNRAGMLSLDGKCHAFDSRANGFVPGEGVGVVVLKRLRDAISDGDYIHGVIAGTGINQDGATNGIIAPSAKSQERLETFIYDRFDIDPATIGVVEAHGTGTILGDPIEFSAISRAFRKYTDKKQFCAIGSVKTNIGHAAAAAGVASVLKLLLGLKHKQIAPSLNFVEGNPAIDFANSPFYVNTGLEQWESIGEVPRRAAVSSFAFSGTNAHLVLEEFVPAKTPVIQSPGYLIVLSALSAQQLKQQASNLLTYCSETADVSLNNLSYTLFVGRMHLPHRLTCVIRNQDELGAAIQQWLERGSAAQIYTTEIQEGHIREQVSLKKFGNYCLQECQTMTSQQVNSQEYLEHLAAIADLYIQGYSLEFERLFISESKRIPLPTYPFAKESYWVEGSAQQEADFGTVRRGAIHPLVQVNNSDFNEQRYSAEFGGDEAFIKHYQIDATGYAGQKLMPGLAYLEMARVAVEQAIADVSPTHVIELRDVRWAMPVAISAQDRVDVVLSLDDDQPTQQVNYKISSLIGQQQTIHCQGHAVMVQRIGHSAVDIQQLKAEMQSGAITAEEVYATFGQLGMAFGPTYRGITDIYRGEAQVLAQIQLPPAVENDSALLAHPGALVSAMQAVIGLDGWQDRLVFPFQLESMQVLSACSSSMYAWVRNAPSAESQSSGYRPQVDIDLYDEQGNICVLIRGLCSREPTAEDYMTDIQSQHSDSLTAVPVWKPKPMVPAVDQRVTYAEHYVLLSGLPSVSENVLSELMPNIQCIALPDINNIALAEWYEQAAEICLAKIQSVLNSGHADSVLMQVIAADQAEQRLLGGLAGMFKTAALENPLITGQCILVEQNVSADVLAQRLHEEQQHTADSIIAYRDGLRQVSGWEVVEDESQAPAVAFKDHGVYLITGGMGGLGRLFAREILQQTSHAQVILTGRSANSDLEAVSGELLPELVKRIAYQQLDLSNLDALRDVLQQIHSEYGQLNGIIHSAGMIADNLIANKTVEEFREVLAPKVSGTYNLDHASADLELDFMVLFSSMTAAFGSPGQADYVVANAFMDRYASYRNDRVAKGERIGKTISINWPYWQSGGMNIDEKNLALLEHTVGVRPLDAKTGIRGFYQTLTLPGDQSVILEGDVAKIQSTLLSDTPDKLKPQGMQSMSEPEPIGFVDDVEGYLREQFSEVLQLPVDKVDPYVPIATYGIDSILATQIIYTIRGQLEIDVPMAAFFQDNTIADAAEIIQAIRDQNEQVLEVDGSHEEFEEFSV